MSAAALTVSRPADGPIYREHNMTVIPVHGGDRPEYADPSEAWAIASLSAAALSSKEARFSIMERAMEGDAFPVR